jgi:hypothetical protein
LIAGISGWGANEGGWVTVDKSHLDHRYSPPGWEGGNYLWSMKDRGHNLQLMQLSDRKELQKTIFTAISRQRDEAVVCSLTGWPLLRAAALGAPDTQ